MKKNMIEDVYAPVSEYISCIDGLIYSVLTKTNSKAILDINSYLIESGGKKIRPAIAAFSAKAAVLGQECPAMESSLKKVISAIELIHRASLIHDDVIDNSGLRHNRVTINQRWGPDAAIILGDYAYSAAFELVSQCGNNYIIECLSAAVKIMCEGELMQVRDRNNLGLSEEDYLAIVKNKTAALFAASCRIGGILAGGEKVVLDALSEYGLNFGIAFQIVDDYLDIIGDKERLGKSPGQDIKSRELTLPMINIMELSTAKEKVKVKELFLSALYEGSPGKDRFNKEALREIRLKLSTSGAADKTKETVGFFLESAKKNLRALPPSIYNEGLCGLADFVYYSGFS